MTRKWHVIVVGAGAAGLMAAASAAVRGRRTLLLEKTRTLGVKILMSGGTRCNITQATDARGIIEAFGRNGRFLHAPLRSLPPERVVQMFNELGVPTKVEETGKVFPVSDRAIDVRDALVNACRHSGVTIASQVPVASIERIDEGFHVHTPQNTLECRSLLITTGGQSYPSCGTTGDGYAWAKALGHKIVPPRPALTPIRCSEPWVNQLKGLTVPDVTISLPSPDGTTRPISRRGSFLFTHFGFSGPAALDISRYVARPDLATARTLQLDFCPGYNDHDIRQQLRTTFSRLGSRQLDTTLCESWPRRLVDALLKRRDIDPATKCAEVSKVQMNALIDAIKRTVVSISGTVGFRKAEVTAGGVALDEIDSRTMQSKLCPGFFFAGEILDLDGPIGGYNFQAAFSTGHLAGQHV